jgi:hypothetical protein
MCKVNIIYDSYNNVVKEEDGGGDDGDGGNFYLDQDINILNNKRIRGKYLDVYQVLLDRGDLYIA